MRTRRKRGPRCCERSGSPERLLALSLIKGTMDEGHHAKTKRQRDAAWNFFKLNNKSFVWWCSVADLSPTRVIEAVRRYKYTPRKSRRKLIG